MDKKELFEKIFELIPCTALHHQVDGALGAFFNDVITDYFRSISRSELVDAEPFNGMRWPYHSLGNIDSYNCFTFGEMVQYAYYWNNRDKYKVVFDVGGNIGPDTVILSRFGYEVYTFEPDPENFKILQNNVLLNECKNASLYCKGLSDKNEILEFVRVKGNTTASHVAGERDCYGETETFKIETMTFQNVGVQPDLIKINIEGHEKSLIPAIGEEAWRRMDGFIELHGEDCRKVVFDYFNSIGLKIYSQKLGWKNANSIEELPLTYREGVIFVSNKNQMSWGFN